MHTAHTTNPSPPSPTPIRHQPPPNPHHCTPIITPQTQPDKAGLAEFGLDLVEGCVRNNVEAGVLEPAISKTKMIQVGWGGEAHRV